MIAWIIALFLGGMFLLLAELFLPGLVCGILGTIMLIASMILSVQALPDYAIPIIITETGLAVGVFIFGLWFVPRFGARWGYAHITNMDNTAGYVSAESNTSLLGQTGTAVTLLRPAGTADFGPDRIDVVTDGDFIEPGTPIRVIAVEGARVVVERV